MISGLQAFSVVVNCGGSTVLCFSAILVAAATRGDACAATIKRSRGCPVQSKIRINLQAEVLDLRFYGEI